MDRRTVLSATALLGSPSAFAHHGWSSFDQNRPLWLEGKALSVAWRNPHAELQLEPRADLALPADLARRELPRQTAPVDAAAILKATTLPTRKERRWEIELAPLTRLEAWQVPVINAGDTLGVIGFTFAGEKGDAVLRVEYLFFGGKVYALRSAPA